MIRIRMMIKKAVPKALSMDIPSMANMYRWTDMVRAGSKTDIGIPSELPAVRIRAAVSQ
jgi:hypothetical protein